MYMVVVRREGFGVGVRLGLGLGKRGGEFIPRTYSCPQDFLEDTYFLAQDAAANRSPFWRRAWGKLLGGGGTTVVVRH